MSYQEYPERLLLTYRPEEGPEDTEEVSIDESKPLPVDDVAISESDVDVPHPQPPPPTNLDTGDLLVKFSDLVTFVLLFDIYYVGPTRTCDTNFLIHKLLGNRGHDMLGRVKKISLYF